MTRRSATGKYNRDGTPFTGTLPEWAEAFGKQDRQVARTVVGRTSISTVFLSLDHSFGAGPPLLFETMVFGSTTFEDTCLRYSTEEQAKRGHEEIVQLVKNHYAIMKLDTWIAI